MRALLALLLLLLPAAGALGAPRPWPPTTTGVHVFSDQLAGDLTPAQVRFAARRYDGAQKLTRSQADGLRAVHPGFLVLHYRLGIGIGYRATGEGCAPTGEPIRIVEGDRWVIEWPDGGPGPGWLATRGGRPVLNCSWGWYLADLGDPGFRAWWSAGVARGLAANDDDGVFMDSLSVPSYLGASDFRPELPALDPAFEAAWSARIAGFLRWLGAGPVGRAGYLVPNAGSWITTRDRTDYSAADGVMVEGFAVPGDGGRYPEGDWALQASRVLRMARAGRAVIGQAYAAAPADRMFALGTYLLLRGRRSYLSLESGPGVEWWPEYDAPAGPAAPNAARSAPAAGASFGEALEQAQLRFSNHAQKRLETRGIALNDDGLARLAQAVPGSGRLRHPAPGLRGRCPDRNGLGAGPRPPGRPARPRRRRGGLRRPIVRAQ